MTIKPEQLLDQEWRLSHLYWITDKKGRRTLFQMNRAQRLFYRKMKRKNIILKARQLGFSTFIQLYLLDVALFYPDTKCGVIAHTLKDAQNLFREKILFAYENLPNQIKEIVGVRAQNMTELLLSNGSSIVVGTSLRSGTYNYLHISEFGKIAARRPDRAEEIVSGALNTQEPEGFCFIESTAEGKGGRFFEMVQRARGAITSDEGATTMDYAFAFFPWFEDPAYVLPATTPLTPEAHKYFAGLEEEHGIVLTAEQKAWYMKKAEEQGDKMWREFPSHPDEPFSAAIKGAYYGELMQQLEKQGRITDVPYDPRGPKVEVSVDIGWRDDNCLWFTQTMPSGQIRVIDFMKVNGKTVHEIAAMVEKKGYRIGRFIGPHDSEQHGKANGLTYKEEAEAAGMTPWEVVPRTPDVQIGINAVRNILPRCYFDKTKCADGITSLKQYRRDWNERLGDWSSKPRHDEHSHAADAFRTFAQAPEVVNDKAFDEKEIVAPKFGAV